VWDSFFFFNVVPHDIVPCLKPLDLLSFLPVIHFLFWLQDGY